MANSLLHRSKRWNRLCSLIFLIIIFSSFQNARAYDVDGYPRDYQITVGNPNNLRVIAPAGITLNTLAYDVYYKGLSPHIPDSIGQFIEPLWGALWTFNLTMWPHDAGHWGRARQAGGDFIMNEYRFPFPVMEMIQSDTSTPAEDSLTSSGGFEINTLMRRQTEFRFYQSDYRYADELIHSFIQSIFFPMYTLLLAPASPENVDTWTDTYGDPVEYTKLVYEHYTGRPSVTADNVVDPELVDLYREVFWVNILTTLLDPMLYQSARAFARDMKTESTIVHPWMVGNENLKWSYGLQFNPGALGYEIYFLNHFRINKHYLVLYGRWGRPFKNVGIGAAMPIIVQRGRWAVGAAVDIWDQDIYGKGGAATLSPNFTISKHYQASVDLSWKDHGYLLGQRLDDNIEVLGNIHFRF